ncbi:MAG: hypothetical protein ACE5DO_13745 [Desulfobacterales bacterium]
MNSTRFRYVFIVLGFFCFLAVSSCTGEPAPKSPETPVSNYLNWLPEETNFVFYANFKTLKQTSFGEKLRSEIENRIRDEDEEYLDFVEKTGLDIKRDVDELWAAGLPDGLDDHANGGAIVIGKFDKNRIVEYFKEEHAHRYREESFQDHKIYLAEKNDEIVSFTFLNSKTILVGGLPWVKAVLENSESDGTNIMNNPVMARYIQEVPRKDQMWSVLNLDEIADDWAEEFRRKGSGFKGTESLKNMKSFIFYANIEQKADLYLKGNFTKEEEAELFAEMLTGFKAMAKLLVSDDIEAIDMLNDIKIKSKGAVVKVTAKVDDKFIEKLEQKSKIFKNNNIKLL